MIRKIISVLFMVGMVGVLSCSDDGEPVHKESEISNPKPPPQTVFVTARMQATTSNTADVYYMCPYPTGAWTYVGTVSGTSCQTLTSISAGTGDVVYFAIFDGSTALSYRARSGSCASINDTLYCGEPTDGTTLYSVTVGGSNVSVGIQIVVDINGNFTSCI
jgi:hypothetical protein